MNFLECPIYKASGQCKYDDKLEECRKCSFKECLMDMASDYADDIEKVVVDFITKERKVKEKKG